MGMTNDERRKLLKYMSNHARTSCEELALMLGLDEAAVEAEIASLEKDRVILGYNTVIAWDRTEDDPVTALIEVTVTPQRDLGFDRLARRLYSHPQVSSCYLMSGSYDLLLIIEDKSLKDVARFVSDHIAPAEAVLSTKTHFILKKYKVNGTDCSAQLADRREAVIL
ncbi:MAG: Lrp/AsnC family transcriptional regulator [Eubacteriales bacterium]|nr:Lrp/AsnC family transcriptional regulator [Eubacteriales bacterium]